MKPMDERSDTNLSKPFTQKVKTTKKPYWLFEIFLQACHFLILLQAISFIFWKRSQELNVYTYNNVNKNWPDDILHTCSTWIKTWDGVAYLFLNFQALDFIATRAVYYSLDKKSWFLFYLKFGIELMVLLGNITVLILMKVHQKVKTGDPQFCFGEKEPLQLPIIAQFVTIGFTSFYIVSNIGYFFLKKKRIQAAGRN